MTVAPVSAKIAIQRVVTPNTVVARKTALRPSAMVMFCQMLASVAREEGNQLGHSDDAVLEQRRVGGFQSHVRTAAHGHSHIRGRKRWSVVNAVADHGDRTGLFQIVYDRKLGIRQKLGLHFEPESESNGIAGAPVVARSMSVRMPRSFNREMPSMESSRGWSRSAITPTGRFASKSHVRNRPRRTFLTNVLVNMAFNRTWRQSLRLLPSMPWRSRDCGQA